MIEKKTVISQIEVLPTGRVQVRMENQVIEDGKVIAITLHRTAIEPDTDFSAHMGLVNDHMVALGHARLLEDHHEDLRAHVTVAQTPAKVAAFKALRAREAARLEAEARGAGKKP